MDLFASEAMLPLSTYATADALMDAHGRYVRDIEALTLFEWTDAQPALQFFTRGLVERVVVRCQRGHGRLSPLPVRDAFHLLRAIDQAFAGQGVMAAFEAVDGRWMDAIYDLARLGQPLAQPQDRYDLVSDLAQRDALDSGGRISALLQAKLEAAGLPPSALAIVPSAGLILGYGSIASTVDSRVALVNYAAPAPADEVRSTPSEPADSGRPRRAGCTASSPSRRRASQ